MSSKDIALERNPAVSEVERGQRVEAAIADSPTAIMCVSSEMLRYVFINQAFADLVGRSAAAVMKSDPYEIWRAIAPGDYDRQRHEAGRVAAGEIDRFEMDVMVHPENGKPRSVRTTVVGSRDERGRLDYITVYYTDLEEQRAAERARDRAEAQLLQAQKLDALGKLAGGVAHDFNNRLLVIIGYSELVKSQLPPDSELAAQIDMIMASANRAAELSRQLLAYSRRQVLLPEPFDLNLTVNNMRRMLGRLIGDSIELATVLQARRFAFSDQGQIEQVIMNLAINARDAMPTGGRLTLETGDVTIAAPAEPPASAGKPGGPAGLPPGDYVTLVVNDTGTGIDDSVMPHIFEPFFTTKDPGQGTGLGLSMVEGIVRQSGGAIDVTTRIGAGTRVRVHLPCTRSVPEQPSPPSDIRPYAPGLETVLVCDDDEGVRRLLVDVIGLRAYHILQAASGREALDLARQHDGRIDLLVTDVVMPGLGGVELAAELRKRDPDLRVLYLSGYIERLELLSGSLNHQTRFLAKPFIPAQLTQMVNAIFERPRAGEDEAKRA